MPPPVGEATVPPEVPEVPEVPVPDPVVPAAPVPEAPAAPVVVIVRSEHAGSAALVWPVPPQATVFEHEAVHAVH